MTFDELLAQVREVLRSKGRVSYRALRLQFHIELDVRPICAHNTPK